ncbi:MAG TPA: PKD domain-containing protein, partial [Chitinophagaceae bacterium]|nr:PKD domain-containing protein [Chitinophagaceae bacterium]
MKTKTPYVKPLRLFFYLLLSFTFFGSFNSFAQRQNIIFESTGEETNAVNKWAVVGGCCSYSIQKSADVSRAGSYSLRFEVNKTDNLFANGRRAEVNLPASDKMPLERWYGMSYYIPKDYIIDQPNLFEVVNQWHDVGSAGETEMKSPFDFIIDNGRWGLDIRWAASASASSASELKADLAPIAIGAWTDFVFHIRFSTGSDGVVEIWKDGTKVYTRNGPVGFNHAVAPFFKMGIYKWPWNPQDMPCCGNTNSTQKVLYIDEFRLGNANATYNDVAPAAISAPANKAPVAKAGNDISLTLPTILTTLNGSQSYDPDGSIASYKWTRISGPTIFSLLDPAGITTTLLNLIQGSYAFKLTVTDNNGMSSSDTVVVDVKPLLSLPTPNKPPVANAGGNITITLPTNSTALNGTASSDPDGTISDYAWTKTAGPGSYSITDPTSATTTITNLTQGTYTFKLAVTDNSDATTSATVTVTVNPAVATPPPPPNQVPVANAGANVTMTLPTNFTTLDGTGSSDPDGSISTYAWTRTGGPAGSSLSTPGAAKTALNYLVQGTYTFKLTVTDNGGAAASSTVTIIVNAAPPPPPPANEAPVADAGSDVTITLPVNTATIDGSASTDPDGTIANYTWTKTNGPTSYSISNPGSSSTSVVNLTQGTYTFKLTVTDNVGATATSTVRVIVNAAAAPPPPANEVPVANAGGNVSITLPVNTASLDGSASSDPDGSISTYAWTKTNGPASYNIANPGSSTTAIGNLVEGTYTFKLTVTDNDGASASSTVTVTVKPVVTQVPPPPVNQAPVANAGSNVAITLPTNTATLNGSASKDPDGSISKYAWTKTNGPASFNITSPGSATTAIGNLAQGVYTFTLTVTDNSGASASSTVTVTVNAAPAPPANQAPVANAGSNVAITLPTNTATLNGSASKDPDGSISKYAWTKTNGPASFNITSPGSATTAIG